MAVNVTNLTAGIGTSDPQSTASVSPTAGAVLILTITASRSDAGTLTSVVPSGLSGTWTLIGTYAWASRRTTWLYECKDWSGSGAISLDATVTNFQEVGWVLDEVTGADAATPFASIVADGAGTGTSTTRTLTTGGTPVAGDATYSSLSLESNIDIVPEAGWAGLGETTTGSLGVRRIASAWDDAADTSAAWTWDGSGQGNGGFVLIIKAAATTPSVTQSHYRWGLDDGSEAAHTFAAAEDTGITVATGLRRLLRVQLDETAGADVTAAYTLQYKRSDEGADQWRDL